MLTVQNYCNSIKEDLEYFPRNVEGDGLKRIFSVHVLGCLPESFFMEGEEVYSEVGAINIECLKSEEDKHFILSFYFTNNDDGKELDSYSVFAKDQYQRMWDLMMIFLRSMPVRGDVHFLHVKDDLQDESKYDMLFEGWMNDIYAE